ncbi:MAG: hypothetical protein ABIU97_07890, partial [Dehalococcoidia bacterium]
ARRIPDGASHVGGSKPPVETLGANVPLKDAKVEAGIGICRGAPLRNPGEEASADAFSLLPSDHVKVV